MARSACSWRDISAKASAVLGICVAVMSHLGNGVTASESTTAPMLTSASESPVTDDIRRPNIVLVLADDVGFADVGWNKEILPFAEQEEGDLTPTLTRLAREGIIFDQAYSQQMCSPSRAALLTGRHPVMYGMHDAILRPDRAYGLPLNQRLLSESLKELGYETALIGKWHLGFCNTSYLPTSRGFDSFLGAVTGRMHYYRHSYRWGPNYTTPSYVMHNNTEPTQAGQGEYATSFFAKHAWNLIMKHNKDKPLFLFLPFTAAHTPLSAPAEFWHKANRLLPRQASRQRKSFAAVLLALDAAMGSVVDALRTRNMWNNTIFVFTADNGPNPVHGNSYPLRGAKGTLFEGGVRVPTFIRSNIFKRKGYRETVLVHISDWYPTLVRLAGGEPSKSENILEGSDFSLRLLAARGETASVPIRQEMLHYLKAHSSSTCARHNANCCQRINGAYRYGNLKIVVVGTEKAARKGRWYHNGKASRLAPWLRYFGHQLQWQYGSYANLVKLSDGHYWGLFNVIDDPYEEINRYHDLPDDFNHLRNKLLSFCALARKPSLWEKNRRRPVANANPKYFNKFWTHGWC